MTFSRMWTMHDVDQTDVRVIYDYEPGRRGSGMFGPPEFYDPGEPSEITILSVIDMMSGHKRTLTPEERASCEIWIEDHHDRADGGDFFGFPDPFARNAA